MTLTHKLDVDNSENMYVKGHLKVLVRTQTHTHTADRLLYSATNNTGVASTTLAVSSDTSGVQDCLPSTPVSGGH